MFLNDVKVHERCLIMGLFNLLKSFFGKSKSMSYKVVESPVEINLQTKTKDIHPIYQRPLSNGLLPGEILLIDWLDRRNPDTPFPKYFSYTYGLQPEESVTKLLEEGFIMKASPMKALESLKVAELKEILRGNELKVSGRKQELIRRLHEHLSEDEIDHYVKDKPYQMTAKGEKALKEYYYIVPAHVNNSKDGIYNVATAIEYVNEDNDTPSNDDIAWILYQRALSKYYKQQSYGLYRNVYLNMAEQFQRNQKRKDAYVYFLIVFIIDLSGLSNNGMLSRPSSVMIAPGILQRIQKLEETLGLDEEALKKLFDTAWEKIIHALPFHYLHKETCYECLLAAIDDHEEFVREELQKSYDSIDKESLEKEYSLTFMPL